MLYPILYLYRHYLEVMIKGQIRDAQRHLGIERPSRPNPRDSEELAKSARGHDLSALWHYLLFLTHQLHPTLDSSAMGQATDVINSFVKNDSGGDAFRYPETLSGSPTLTSLKEVHLRHLKDQLDQAENALLLIEGILSYKDEISQMIFDSIGSPDAY